jgi:sugar phosphate isomerase/epimerase
MKRRTFLETSIAAGFASALTSTEEIWAAPPAHRVEHIGLQLYTVRDQMKQDFEGTLAKVAQIGYKEVEFAGYFGHSAKDVRALLDKDGLTSPSEHVPYETLENKWPETLEEAHVVGQKFIVCPWIDETQRKSPDGWKRAAELFNRAGEASQKAGIQFAYHNHAFEFEPSEALGGKMPYDFLLAETDPKLVKMEMDLCWITVGGQDPVKYFDRYPGRFPLVHVKDYVKDPNTTSSYSGATGSAEFKGRLAAVGQGGIDWKRIFAQSGKGGVQHYFVENDDAKSIDDPKVSYQYLAKLRF